MRERACQTVLFLLLPIVLPLMLSTFLRVGVHHCLFPLGVGVHRSLFVHLQTCLPSEDPHLSSSLRRIEETPPSRLQNSGF